MQPIIVSFLLALAIAPIIGRIVSVMGWVDRPNKRKHHIGDVPLAGGMLIAVTVLAYVMISGRHWPAENWGLAVGLTLVFVVGFIDDRHPIRARYRLAAQILAAFVACLAGNAVVTGLGEWLPGISVSLGLMAIPFTLIAMTGLMNAYNMSDGLDGLCGTYSLVTIIGLYASAVLSAPAGSATVALAPVVLPVAGALLGFLLFNLQHPWRQRASMFLGDGGSMSLGLFVAWLATRVAGDAGASPGVPPAVALWIVAMPLLDMTSCLTRRLVEREKPLAADNKHIHHLLRGRGLSVRATVAVLVLAQAGAGAIGIVAWQAGVPAWLLFWTFVLLALGFITTTIHAWRQVDVEIPSEAATEASGPSKPARREQLPV